MKAAIYTRVSTSGQALNGESLDMQKERLIEYVKAHNWELYKAYEDGGFSGKDINRPAFQEMMKDTEAKKFDVLVVYKIDRLSRSVLDFHTTMKFLEKQNISFVSVTQQFDTTTSMGRLMLNILVDFANFEREINVDRSLDSYLKRLNDGVSSGRIPLGYKRVDKKIIIDEKMADTAKNLFDLAFKGITVAEISRRTGFSKYQVKSTLSNPFYCGYLVRRRDKYNHRIKEDKWEWHKAKHKSLISLEDWQLIAEMRKERTKIVKKKNVGLFARLIYCTKCKHNLSLHSKKRKNAPLIYYECDHIKQGDQACGQYIKEEVVESILLDHINRIYEIRLPVKKEITTDYKLETIDRKIKKVIRFMEEDIISIEEGKPQIEALKKEKAEILASRIIQMDYSKLAERIKQIKQIYPLATREEKAELWHLLIRKISAQKPEMVVYWKYGGDYRIKRAALKKNRRRLTSPASGSNAPHLHHTCP